MDTLSLVGFVVTIATVLVTFGALRQQLKTVIETVGNADSGLVKKVNRHDREIVALTALMKPHKHGD